MANSNFIADATKNSHGQFKAKAKKAGMSTAAFAAHVKSNPKAHSRVTVKQAQLAATLMGLNKGKKAMPMDAEDMKDGGRDEAKEKS